MNVDFYFLVIRRNPKVWKWFILIESMAGLEARRVCQLRYGIALVV